MVGDRQRPADVAVLGFESRPVAVDLTISHPLRPSQWRSLEEAKRHLVQREERKCNKYLATSARAGWLFTPAAFHPWGGQGPMCAAFLEKLARRTAGDVHGKARSNSIASFWNRVSLSVMKGVAEQLSIALHVRNSITGEPPFTAGPVQMGNNVPPLVDIFGNLLPEALPSIPSAIAGCEQEEGPLLPDEIRIGCLKIRVRAAE